jgi:hypothetical protein
MSHPRILRLAILMVLVVGCAEGIGVTDLTVPDSQAHVVAEPALSESPGFYFLPPLVRNPDYSGTFDPDLEPVVEVLCLTAGCGESPHASFDRHGGSGSEVLRVNADAEHYIVNWHTSHTGVVPGEMYRVRVRLGETVLGAIDVEAVADVPALGRGRVRGPPAALVGQTLVVKFRIETDLVAGLTISPEEAALAPGETQQFTASLVNGQNQAVTAQSLSWTSADEAVATVDADGLATALAPGTTIITATSGALSASATLVVEEAGSSFLVPGDTEAIASLDGWSVRCLVWNGRVCVRPQMRVDCGTCGSYVECGVWHDVTAFNNDQSRTTRNFCAIASGSQAFSSAGFGATAASPRGCGLNSSSHPICEASRATVHAAGFGIHPSMGLVAQDAYCATDSRLLTMECTDW